MVHVITLTDTVDFNPTTEVDEVIQNCRTILKTRVGTVPLDRDFGLSWDNIDKPYHVARSLMQADIIDAIETYEPRAKVKSVSFDDNETDAMDGITKPRVVVTIGEE